MGYIPRAKETEKPQTGKATENTPVPMKEESLGRVPKKEDTMINPYGGRPSFAMGMTEEKAPESRHSPY